MIVVPGYTAKSNLKTISTVYFVELNADAEKPARFSMELLTQRSVA